jgi:nitrite reductase/ring-hydroxylating ferredoxin subunit
MTQSIAPRELRIRRALEHLRHGTTDEFDAVRPFGPEEFTDPEIARRERDLVFGRFPSIVAHRSEVPEPNDFITLQMPRNNIIVMRQRDGSVKAFVNLCRHRGALLEERDKGRCRLFSCGYHRWSYNPDGSLRAVTRDSTFGAIDAHPNTAARHIHTNVLALEDFGRHCRFIAPRKSIDRWIDEDPGDRSLARHVTETHFLLPNSTLLRQPDQFQLLTFRPHPASPAAAGWRCGCWYRR